MMIFIEGRLDREGELRREVEIVPSRCKKPMDVLDCVVNPKVVPAQPSAAQMAIRARWAACGGKDGGDNVRAERDGGVDSRG